MQSAVGVLGFRVDVGGQAAKIASCGCPVRNSAAGGGLDDNCSSVAEQRELRLLAESSAGGGRREEHWPMGWTGREIVCA